MVCWLRSHRARTACSWRRPTAPATTSLPGLRAAGHDVVAVEAYATRLQPPDSAQLEVLGDADAVVLASGSAVEAWSSSAGDVAGHRFSDVTTAIVTIGRRTAEVAAAHGLDVAAVAGAPDDEAILAAVVAALAVR